MNKIKIMSIMAIIISMSCASMVGAVKLPGDINVKIENTIGLVKPVINIDNETPIDISLNVDIDGTGENITYHVNDTISINLAIEDTSGRDSFFFPRTVAYSVIIMRNITSAKLLPISGFFKRMFPHIELFKSVNVVNSTIAGIKQSQINISLDYYLTNNETYDGEQLTMYIFVMGILPGDVNGISSDIPFVDHKKVTLIVDYI